MYKENECEYKGRTCFVLSLELLVDDTIRILGAGGIPVNYVRGSRLVKPIYTLFSLLWGPEETRERGEEKKKRRDSEKE